MLNLSLTLHWGCKFKLFHRLTWWKDLHTCAQMTKALQTAPHRVSFKEGRCQTATANTKEEEVEDDMKTNKFKLLLDLFRWTRGQPLSPEPTAGPERPIERRESVENYRYQEIEGEEQMEMEDPHLPTLWQSFTKRERPTASSQQIYLQPTSAE